MNITFRHPYHSIHIYYSLLHHRLCRTLVDWGAVIGQYLDKALYCAVMRWLGIWFKETLLERFLITFHCLVSVGHFCGYFENSFDVLIQRCPAV